MQSQIEIVSEFMNDLVLQRENLGHVAIEPDGFRDRAGRHVNEAGGDSQGIALPLVPSGDNARGAQLTPKPDGEIALAVATADVIPVQSLKRIGNLLGADDGHGRQVLQIGRDRLGQAGRGPIVGGLPGDIGKAQHRDSMSRSTV